MSVDEFWDSTPQQLCDAVYACNVRAERDTLRRQNELYALAAMIARFVWAKQIPPIERVFERTRTAMDDETLLAQAEALNRMFGGEDLSQPRT